LNVFAGKKSAVGCFPLDSSHGQLTQVRQTRFISQQRFHHRYEIVFWFSMLSFVLPTQMTILLSLEHLYH